MSSGIRWTCCCFGGKLIFSCAETFPPLSLIKHIWISLRKMFTLCRMEKQTQDAHPREAKMLSKMKRKKNRFSIFLLFTRKNKKGVFPAFNYLSWAFPILAAADFLLKQIKNIPWESFSFSFIVWVANVSIFPSKVPSDLDAVAYDWDWHLTRLGEDFQRGQNCLKDYQTNRTIKIWIVWAFQLFFEDYFPFS